MCLVLIHVSSPYYTCRHTPAYLSFMVELILDYVLTLPQLV